MNKKKFSSKRIAVDVGKLLSCQLLKANCCCIFVSKHCEEFDCREAAQSCYFVI